MKQSTEKNDIILKLRNFIDTDFLKPFQTEKSISCRQMTFLEANKIIILRLEREIYNIFIFLYHLEQSPINK
jgi:hypothetical protein